MSNVLASFSVAGILLLLTTALPARGQSPGTGAAASDNPTAYAAVRLVGRTLGRDAMERITEVSGREGGPQPAMWRLVLKDGAGSRELDVAGGKIAADRPLARPPASAGVIKLADLNLDSSGAFDAAETQARKVHLRFDSLNYDLRVSEETGKPVWRLELLDRQGADVGALRLAAHDGTTLATSGRLANNPPPAATPGPRVSEQTPPPIRPAATPRTRVEHTVTTTTTTVRPPVVEDDSDRVDPAPVGPAVHDAPEEEEGGLFTRTGRTIDHTNQRVERSLRKAGATVQRFFTRRSGPDRDEPTD